MHAKVDWFKEQRNPFFCNLIVILINIVFTNCQMTFILKL